VDAVWPELGVTPRSAKFTAEVIVVVLAVITALCVGGWYVRVHQAAGSDGLGRGWVADTLTPHLPAELAVKAAVAEAVVPVTQDPSGVQLSMPWVLARAIDGQSLDLYMVTGDGACVVPSAVKVIESAAFVAVTALSLQKRTGGCPSVLSERHVTLRLSAPLGQRTLFHSPVAAAWKHLLPVS
jgi:hypothetical protein